MTEIRYCYEKQLKLNPALSGMVLVEFTVSATGRVTKSSTVRTTLNNSSVESCIHGKIMRWVFPKPKGQGKVNVKYPFTFKPG